MRRYSIPGLIAAGLLLVPSPVGAQGRINVNTNADTFILSNEGAGLIAQLLAAGYGNLKLY